MKKSQELMTKAFSDKGLGVQLPPFLSETDNISEDSSPKRPNRATHDDRRYDRIVYKKTFSTQLLRYE